jgi:NAD(P)-dependent dehydrogenase (short-subunit alcohol dehydrogenase family)
MNIRGSIVFVTGASRGMGLIFAREALVRGAAKVYAGVRNLDHFSEKGLVPVRIDVADPLSVREAADRAPDVTLLINNAGIAETTSDPLDEGVDEQARRMLETNYFGVMRTTRAFVGSLPDTGLRGIINVLSDATWRPSPILTSYSASKAAAWSYTNNLRLHLKARDIQVLGLHVGFVDTDLTRGLDLPKSNPLDVVRQTFDALESGKSEISADAGTRALKQSLSGEVPGYIDPSVCQVPADAM